MKKPKAKQNTAKNVETKNRRQELIMELGEISLKIGYEQEEIKRHQTVIQGLAAQANGIGTEIQKLDGK